MLQGANLVAAKVQWLLTDIQRGEKHALDLDNGHDQRSVWERNSTACRRGVQLHEEMEAARFSNNFHWLEHHLDLHHKKHHHDHRPQDHHIHLTMTTRIFTNCDHHFVINLHHLGSPWHSCRQWSSSRHLRSLTRWDRHQFDNVDKS